MATKSHCRRTCDSCRFFEPKDSICCVDPPQVHVVDGAYGPRLEKDASPLTYADRPACHRYQLDLSSDGDETYVSSLLEHVDQLPESRRADCL